MNKVQDLTLGELSVRKRQLSKKVEKLENTYDELSNEKESLSKQVTDMKAIILEQRDEIDYLEVEINEKKAAIDFLEKRIKSYEDRAEAYKEKMSKKSIDESSTISKSSMIGGQSMPVRLGGGFDVINKSKGGERIIAGYASVIEVDKEDHIIPKSALEYGIQTLLNDSEYSNLMLIHQNVQIGKIISNYKNLETHVDDKGLFICAKIRSDLEIANEVWGMILDGKLNGFSIAGEIVESTIECDDEKCVKKIEKLNIFEISVCDFPVNAKSGFVVVSKSSDTADVGEVEDVINNKEIQMVKKKVKDDKEVIECSEEETPTETETTTETKGDEEVIEASEPTMDINQTIEELSRQVAALTGIVEQMNTKSKEVEKQDEEEEEEEDEEEEIVEESKDTPTEEKSETVSISIDDLNELKKSIEEMRKMIEKSEEVSELEVAIKAKDDEIASLTTKIETLGKAEVEPQTTNTVEEEVDIPEDTSDVSFVKDTLGKGVFYHNPDY